MSGGGSEENAKQYPENDVIYPRNSERQMADAAAEQAHFAENRSENRQRIHTDANPDRGDELDGTDAGEELVWMTRQDPTASETTEGHRNGDIRYRYGPKRAFFAIENAGVQMQAGNQAENQHANKCQSGERRQHSGTGEHLKIIGGNLPKNRRAQDNADHDLDDHEGHKRPQSGCAQQHNWNHYNNKRLKKEDGARGQQVGALPLLSQCAMCCDDSLDRQQDDLQV